MSGFASSTPHRGLAQRGSRRSRHRLIGAALMGVMLFASAVQAEGVPPDKAKPQEVKKANKAFGEGIKLFQKGDYEKAIKVFQQAHDIVARPDASLMIARSYRELGQLVEARAQFDKAKSEAEAAGKTSKKKDEYAQTIQQIDKDIADLDGILVKLEIALVDAPEGTKVDIDGDPVNQDLSKPVLSSPGTLSITATAPDGKKVTEQIQVNAGQTTKVELNFSKPPPPKKAAPAVKEPTPFEERPRPPPPKPVESAPPSGGAPLRTFAYVAGGVGVVGFGAFAIFGSLSNAKYKDLKDNCPNGQCPPSSAAVIDEGKKFQTIANIGLVLGIAGVGAGVTLFVLSTPAGEAPAPKPKRTAELGIGFRSVQLRGTF